jgi:hypothetical protein
MLIVSLWAKDLIPVKRIVVKSSIVSLFVMMFIYKKYIFDFDKCLFNAVYGFFDLFGCQGNQNCFSGLF